jgi:hypothetical protein
MSSVTFGGRWRVALALAGTIGLGLLSRLRPVGWPLYDKSLGDVLYAVAAYCALALVTPARWWGAGRWKLAGVALAVCEGLEFFQATGIPERYAHLAAVRWLVGTTFAWHDVACYVAGVAAAFALDRTVPRPGGLSPRPGAG